MFGYFARKRTDTIAHVMKAIAPLDVAGNDADSLGDAYEFLISKFASESGKKAGEFYTPQEVSELLTKLTLAGKLDSYQDGMRVYDPAGVGLFAFKL